MTKAEIKSLLSAIIDVASPGDENQDLTQAELTAVTDSLASDGLDTVNPNGPCYPSTPR